MLPPPLLELPPPAPKAQSQVAPLHSVGALVVGSDLRPAEGEPPIDHVALGAPARTSSPLSSVDIANTATLVEPSAPPPLDHLAVAVLDIGVHRSFFMPEVSNIGGRIDLGNVWFLNF
jgi:hypothetical protein